MREELHPLEQLLWNCMKSRLVDFVCLGRKRSANSKLVFLNHTQSPAQHNSLGRHGIKPLPVSPGKWMVLEWDIRAPV